MTLSHNLKPRYQQYIRYIKQNDPRSVYTPHILNNCEYGPIDTTMTHLKQITKTSLLNPHEQFYVQSHYHHKELILEQNASESNPMYQLIFDPILCHHLQYTPINTPTLPLPRPYYRAHPSTYWTAHTKQYVQYSDHFMGHDTTRHDIAFVEIHLI
jgi:hypothetical protein